MSTARIILPAIITGAFLTYLANLLGLFAVLAPAPYNQYIVVASAILLAVIPILVANGIIPALQVFGGFSFVITGTLFTMIGDAIAGFAPFLPAYANILLALGAIIVVIGQILVQYGIIPALAKARL